LLETIKETRNLMSELSSPSMNEIGLSAAISEWLEENIENRYNLKTQFIDNMDNLDMELLEENVQVILFRNIRELLANTVKHAQARNVSVTMQTEDNLLKISVKDDGIGFDSEVTTEKNGQNRCFGLFSVEERMSDAGGSLKIFSGSGLGCTAILTVPVRTV
jgi:signal transduction histidine kinase